MSESLEDTLRGALRDAMKTRDTVARSAIRSALAAIANAGAVEMAAEAVPPGGNTASVAGGRRGLGSGDVPRRSLSEAELVEIVRAEVTGLDEAALQYERLGKHEDAARLQAEARVLERLLVEASG